MTTRSKSKSKPPAAKSKQPAAKAKPAAKSVKAAAKSAKPASKSAKPPAKSAKPAAKSKPAAPESAKPAAANAAGGAGTKGSPWQLTTPPGTSKFEVYRDESASPPALVCKVGTTELRYQLRCIEDLHSMLKEHGDWMPLGGADEQKAATDGTVEAWGRSPANPVGGWYGLRKGFRGRFAVYLPAVLEALGLAEVEHEARNNRMRAR